MFTIKIFEKYPNCTIFATAFILSVLVYIPLSNAAFWYVDDHEIITFHQRLIESHTGFWQSAYHTWLATEIGSFPNGSRFRPMYYFIRILKSGFFENNSTYWFIFHTALFGTAIFAFGKAIERVLPICITVAAMAVLASLPFNMDMWSRLGPGENGAFFFFMIFLLAISRLGTNTWAWPLSCVAAAATMGYKENFILLLIPLFVGYYYQRYFIRQKTPLLWASLPCAMAILLTIVIVNILQGSTKHVYELTTSTVGAFDFAIAYFTSYHFIVCLLCFLPLIFTAIFCKTTNKCTELKRDFVFSCLVFCITIALSCGNYVFYQGQISKSTRYAFPYLFFLILPALITASFCIKHLKNNMLVRRSCILSIALLILPVTYAQIKIFLHSSKHVAETQSYKAILDMGKNYTKLAIINTSQPIDAYEAHYSLKVFSKAHLTAPTVLYFPLFFPTPDTNLNKTLEASLKEIVAQQQEISLVGEDILLVALRNGLWKSVDYTSDTRPSASILQEHEFFNDKTKNFTRTHLFVPVGKQLIKAFQIIGKIPHDTVYSINGTRLTPSNISFTPEGPLLLLPHEESVNNALTLYVISLETEGQVSAAHLLEKVLILR